MRFILQRYPYIIAVEKKLIGALSYILFHLVNEIKQEVLNAYV